MMNVPGILHAVLKKACLFCSMALLILLPAPAFAIDSYRYLHVSIDSIWVIFVFLFFLVFTPMILMAILYWWNAAKKSKEDTEQE